MEDFAVVNPLLREIGEDVMGFLNEIQMKYPGAISFASGRPDSHFFHIEQFAYYVDLYVQEQAKRQARALPAVFADLGQYNRAKGIINELVADFLSNDEHITVDPQDLMMTVGTQEALSIAVMTLCDRARDVIVVEDPTYVGLPHFAAIAGYQLSPVQMDDDGMSLVLLEEQILAFRQQHKKVKLVYVIPDYQNPTGNSMSLQKRHHLLALAGKYDFFILEDNAYGDFVYEGEKYPTLKSLDKDKRVIYMRSFSKTLYPSLRLSAMVADQLINYNGMPTGLIDLMAKTKGYISVNTPSLTQAVVGGMLIEHQCSLRDMTQKKVADMKRKRDQMLYSLQHFFKNEEACWAKDISWNIPQGGFFITIKVPFDVGKEEVIVYAEKFGVIVTPMSFFYQGDKGTREIRLAFSNLSPDEIHEGIKKLAQCFGNKLNV
jgi:(S)-3,5-dihydroxyphenylglycine transaminase